MADLESGIMDNARELDNEGDTGVSADALNNEGEDMKPEPQPQPQPRANAGARKTTHFKPQGENAWQQALSDLCTKNGWQQPVYNFTSDRRGGRTAWSAVVTVNSQSIAARYWYDGTSLAKAKEDAAEVAYTRFSTTI